MQSTEHSVCSFSSVLLPLFPRFAAQPPVYLCTVPAYGHTSLESRVRGTLKVMYMAVPLCTTQG